MESSGSDKWIDSSINQLRSDPSRLIKSLRADVLRRIEEVNSAADIEIKRIDESLSRDMENFRTSLDEEYKEKIANETARMLNLLSTEMKKLKLQIMESFINAIMSEAALSIRNDPRYGGFLKKCISGGLKEVNGRSATVLISGEDMELSRAVIKEISGTYSGISIRISVDSRADRGGSLVVDDETEVVYNNTVERIIYRNDGQLRREIVRGLKNSDAYQGDNP